MMTRDEILALAREAGLQRTNPGEAIEVVRFAALVAAKEREACAQIAEGYIDQEWPGDELSVQAESTAGDIRARGEKEGA